MSLTFDELDHMGKKDDWRIPLPPTCRKCNYILTGLPHNRCPECGAVFNWKEVRRRASRTWALALRLRHANRDAFTGIKFGLGGWGGLAVAKLLPLMGIELIGPMVQIMAFVMSILTVVLGAQVLNIRRVPKWARVYVCQPPPSMLLGTLAMLNGIALMFATLLIW
ncbi:MAG: hypothetical protein ACYTF1_00460 [Planctomycetota bacterium]|jgi:hypothetical protein